jgi:hypothetical protein
MLALHFLGISRMLKKKLEKITSTPIVTKATAGITCRRLSGQEMGPKWAACQNITA